MRFHFDVRGLDTDPVGKDDFIWRRARVALEGRIYDDLEYEVDTELRDHRARRGGTCSSTTGASKPPRSGSASSRCPSAGISSTSVFNNSFISRSLIGSQLTPGRDIGVMVHGRLGGGKVNYSGGWFDKDGDNVRFSEDLDANEFEEAPVDGTLAGRVEIAPWEATRGLARRLQFGVNTTIGRRSPRAVRTYGGGCSIRSNSSSLSTLVDAGCGLEWTVPGHPGRSPSWANTTV